MGNSTRNFFASADRKLGLPNKQNSQAEDKIRKAAEEVQFNKTKTMEAQQTAEIANRNQKLTKTQMQFLKARFSLAGGASTSANKGMGTSGLGTDKMQSASDLFGKITGRN